MKIGRIALAEWLEKASREELRRVFVDLGLGGMNPSSVARKFSSPGQLQMMSKLAQIARKPYLNRVTMTDIRRTIDEFQLDCYFYLP